MMRAVEGTAAETAFAKVVYERVLYVICRMLHAVCYYMLLMCVIMF